MRNTLAMAGWLSLCASAAGGCSANEPIYFPAPMALEVGAGADEPAASTTSITLPFRPPTPDELMALREESTRRGVDTPWLRADDVALSLLYTITNLGDRPASARLEIDGASEFAAYDTQALRAAAAMDPEGEEDAVLALIRPTPVLLEPGAVYKGTVREDDFDEAALDLDAIGRFMATPASVLINRSEANPIGLEMLPPAHIRPAFFRVQVSFSAGSHMRLEFLLRVRDDAHQLLREQGDAFEPAPMTYVPAALPP
jgi:hypothetical protein